MNAQSTSPLLGIHHITALASDPQQNVDFYVGLLGLRLVKKTVNFDSPDVYHLYYGDHHGTPGTVLTFFPFPRAARGIRGNGELSALAFSLPVQSRDFWIHRLAEQEIAFTGPEDRMGNELITFLDPDGLRLELVFTDASPNVYPWEGGRVPAEYAIRGFFGATMAVEELEQSASHLVKTLGFSRAEEGAGRRRFVLGQGNARPILDIVHDPILPRARPSAGSIHHIAWRVHDDHAQHIWQKHIAARGMFVTEIRDRQYFRSIYFREPGGVLFEIATDQPGFLIDEPLDQLGSSLKLPPWLEGSRDHIERTLPPVLSTGRSVVDAQKNP